MADVFRRAGSGDLALIATLEAACFGAGDGAFSRRQLRALLANPRAYWLITPDAGAVGCWLEADNGRARWARLYSLAVHPDKRGRGLAGQLVEAGFEWMRTQKLNICRAEVKADNRAARSLYARFGFRELDILPDYYAPGQDGLRLVRCLTAPSPERAAA